MFLGVHSGLAIILLGGAACFALIVLCLCSVSLPHGAVGWSAVSDCGISWSYSLTVCY